MASTMTGEPTVDSLTIFIDSLGIDFDDCGSVSTPCGTISFATALPIYTETFSNISKLDLYVTGQNEEEISLWKSNSKLSSDISFLDELNIQSPCTFFDAFSKSIEITFDPNEIKSMKDWFPDVCKQDRTNRFYLFGQLNTQTVNTYTFNNLIINDVNIDEFIELSDVHVLLSFRYEDSLVLNNCSFYNISRSYWASDIHGGKVNAAIESSNVTLYNTSFRNIIMNPSTTSDAPTFIEIGTRTIASTNEISLYMEYCNILNYSNSMGPFLLINARNLYSDIRRVNIFNSIFSDIDTTTALIVSSSFIQSWHVTMNIISCKFLNINFGSILFTQNVHSVYIEDIYITTKQRVKDLTDYNEEHSLISLFVFGDDEVEMKNITLKYLYDVSNNCVKELDRSSSKGGIKTYYCYTPIQFLHSEGIVHITQFIVYNDVEYNTMQQLYSCGLVQLTLCEFKYYESELHHALLYNDGLLVMNEFFIRGVGISYQLLLNKGNAFIDNAVYQYSYYHDVFDPFTLNNHVLFRNDGRSIFGGILEINNSYLCGAAYVAIQLVKGSASIMNTVIEQSQSALVASPDVIYLSVENVQFIKIGAFYTSYISTVLSLIVPPPLFISAQHSIIQNSYISFFDRYGLIVSSPEMWSTLLSFELSLSENSLYDMTLLNNTFDMNTEETLITLDQVHQIQQIISDFDIDLSDITRLNDIVADKLQYLKFNASSTFQFGCLICIYSHATVHMIDNIFYGNDLSDTTPFISIDNAPKTSCISNNIIYGYALYLISGTVTSCYRSKLVNDVLQSTELNCWNGGLGQLNDTYTYASNRETYYFTATQTDDIPLILVESAESVFAAEQIAFLKEPDSDHEVFDVNKTYYNAIEIISGKLFIFDADFHEDLDISYHDNCNVYCFERLNNSENILLQINIECGNATKDDGAQYNELSLVSDATASFKNYFSPYSIELRASGIYYPGGKLYLNYSIYDIFGNEITDYDQDVIITLESSSVYLQMNTTIDRNGCVTCDEGIVIQNISTDHVGNISIINVSIPSNELAVNPAIVFTVAECPSGFGKVGTAKQCGLCDTSHFSFSPTINECFSCSKVHNHSSVVGFNCQGGSSVMIDYNVWFSAVHDKEFISPLYITQNDTIYTSRCPPQQCCQSLQGCTFLLNTKQLCAKNRDVNIPLCGQCIDGMYELYGTAACGNCSNKSNLFHLIPIFIATLLLVITLMYDAKEVNPKDYILSEVNFKKLVRNDEIHCLSIMISKVFLYYYQALSQILYSKGIDNVFSPILNIFELSFSLSASSSGICIFPLITNPLIKILLSSIFILFGFYHFIWISFVIKCFDKNRNRTRLSTESSSGMLDNLDSPKNTFIYVALLKLFVISCSTVLTVAFKLLSCITFPSYMVHFYNPITRCFSGYWVLGLALFLVVIFAFMLMFYKIYKQTMKQRNSHKNIFRKMVKSYNESEWWWEFVLFSRRVTIALCTSIRNVNARDLDAILLTLLLIYVIYHTRKMPFKYNRLNNLEIVCLVILILIFAIFSDDFTKKYTLFTDYFVGLAILLPFILVIYHIIKILIFIASSSSSESFSKIELIKIERAKKRAPITIQTNPDRKRIQIDVMNRESNRSEEQEKDEIAISTDSAVHGQMLKEEFKLHSEIRDLMKREHNDSESVED